MIFRLTQKLAKKIHEFPVKSVLPAENPYLDWTADLFYVNRAQYVIATNTQSLYSVIMHGKGVTGSMNELIMVSKINLSDDNVSPYDAAARINKRPMTLLKYGIPKKVFKTMLPQHGI